MFHPVISSRVFLAEQNCRDTVEAEKMHCFDTDEIITTSRLSNDFRPLNLHYVLAFCKLLDQKLADFPDRKLVYCVEKHPRSVTNAAFLLGSYMVLRMHLAPQMVWACFDDIADELVPYRDATFEPSDFDPTLLDCWSGLCC